MIRPDRRNCHGDAGQGPPMFTTDDYQLLVVIQVDQEVLIYKRSLDSADWGTGFNLASIAGNPLNLPTVDPAVVGDAEASHFMFSVAVDSLGYIHVVGNMHNEPTLQYVRSANPGDITSWIDGSSLIDVSAHGIDLFTYHVIAPLADGSLLFLFHGTIQPTIGFGACRYLYRLDPGETQWAPATGTGLFMSTDAVEGNADPDRAYHGAVHVDDDGVIHATGLWQWTNHVNETRTDLFYVRSDDRGATWETVTGQPIATPFTAASTIAATNCRVSTEQFNAVVSLALDDDGYPMMSCSQNGAGRLFRWNGSAWVGTDEPLGGGHTLLRHRLGGIWRVRSSSASGGTFRCVSLDTGKRVDLGHKTLGGWTPILDRHLAAQGVIAFPYPDGNTPRVYSLGNGARMAAA